MGGPRAWKEAQRRQQGLQAGWHGEEQMPDFDNEDPALAGKRREVYDEYDIDPETEIERSQRIGNENETEGSPGQEDVRTR